ncbi:MAG: DUF3578 domain-containing protein [Cyclobacterium sp.]|uniref:MrcB family domain-containing protein n=1 Tax=Cyclobacterium sp. TaxID=1966343 RepID=UPI0039707E0B
MLGKILFVWLEHSIKYQFKIAKIKLIHQMGFYNQLVKFLGQAKTDDLKTKHYDSEYRGTEVNVSFGKGNSARIPWISFLLKPNTTSNGIYPVYLYFKENDLLILAYGVSETNKPNKNWNGENKTTVKNFFEANYSRKPDRYGSSYLYRTYDIKNLPSREIINHDLDNLITEYIEFLNSFSNLKISHKKFEINQIGEDLKISGLKYSKNLITRFTASLLTKPFVILTGLSGSGKTKLAQAFVQWICQDQSQYRIIPVGADWTNREPLLGYPNALNPEEYVKPDNGVLDLIMNANKHSEKPYFLILDEMNLSHVERYFADFLSVMESGESIPLYSDGIATNGVPDKLSLPSNLFIIGTVNIDETTNMFSPKVLDRANTIEFRVEKEEMGEFLHSIKEINMEVLRTKGVGMAKSFLELAANKSFVTKDLAAINKSLLEFFGELKKTGAEFGYRSATEILCLIQQLSILDETLTTNEKLDIAIMQKLLPKLHGSRRKLCPVLEKLGIFCFQGNVAIVKDVFEKEGYEYSNPTVIYPLSLEKIARMYKGAIDHGFASFAEA